MVSNEVVLVAGHDRRELVREALTLLGKKFTDKLKSSKRIFIHPNLVRGFTVNANTDPEAVRGVLDHISLVRADKIKIGDASFHNTTKAFKQLGYDSLSRSGNIELIDLNSDKTVQSWAYTRDFEKRPIPFSKTVAESDFNIVVVPAKMHAYTIVSLSIKTHIIGSQIVQRSPFGIHARWPWNHTGYAQFHKTLADVYAEHPAELAIIDGTMAMEGDGPATGDTVDLGWLIASRNPVAADALAAYLMGWNPKDIGYLYYLDKQGLGPISISKMKIIGDRPANLRRSIRKPSSYPGIMEWR